MPIETTEKFRKSIVPLRVIPELCPDCPWVKVSVVVIRAVPWVESPSNFLSVPGVVTHMINPRRFCTPSYKIDLRLSVYLSPIRHSSAIVPASFLWITVPFFWEHSRSIIASIRILLLVHGSAVPTHYRHHSCRHPVVFRPASFRHY